MLFCCSNYKIGDVTNLFQVYIHEMNKAITLITWQENQNMFCIQHVVIEHACTTGACPSHYQTLCNTTHIVTPNFLSSDQRLTVCTTTHIDMLRHTVAVPSTDLILSNHIDVLSHFEWTGVIPVFYWNSLLPEIGLCVA